MNRKLLLLPVISLSLIVTAGCGSDPKKAKIESFTASPAIVPTEGGETTLVWDVRSADEIEIFPEIGAVTGTSLTITVTETTEFELIASRKGRRTRKTTTVLVQEPNMVVGSVRSMINGTNVSGAIVVIDGHPAVVTDADGLFAVANVSTPYQLTLVEPVDGSFVVYNGLTRFDPIIDLPLSFAFAPSVGRTVDMTGTVTGAAVPLTETQITVDNPLFMTQFLGGTFTASDVDGTWSGSTIWLDGPTTTTARVHALRYTDNVSPVTSYLYGTTTVDLEDQIDETNVDLTLSSAGVATTTFNYDVSPSLNIADSFALMLFGTPTGTAADEGFQLPEESAVSGTAFDFHITAPDIEGTSIVQTISYQDDIFGSFAFDVQTVPVGTPSVDVTLRPTPWALLPVNNTTFTADSTFAISGPDDVAVIWLINLYNDFDDQFLMVVSADKSITLPDLKSFGLDYSTLNSIEWSAFTIAPRGTVDELAGPGGVLGNNPEYFGFTQPFTAFPYANSVP